MHFNSNDIAGKRYGKLVALEATNERYSNGSVKWKCQCDCGNVYYACSSDLKRKRKSCGCETRLNDMTGKKIGRLTVVERAKDKNGKTYWHCKCECGTEKDICASHLSSGKIVSCGCYSSEMLEKHSITHGMSKTRLYDIWSGMKARCYNRKSSCYSNYGSRGIEVCEAWRDDFMNFYDWSMEHGYSEELSIDRINVNGNYEPNNCRWATKKEQSCNTRRTKLFLHNGEVKTLKQIALDEKINYSTLIRKMSKNEKDINVAISEIKNKIRTKIKKE